MEPLVIKTESQTTSATAQKEQLTIVIPTKKEQINSFENELAIDFKNKNEKIEDVTTIKIQGNSYSKAFCAELGVILSKASSLKHLNINDIFVARLKDEIPQSIESISKGLVGSGLLRLDISNNAVNPYGAKALLIYLEQAVSLEALLICNCGLGTLGATEIAKGLKGTPNLKIFSIGRNRMENAGILQISKNLQHIPNLQELFIYQNTLRKQGLTPLIHELRKHNTKLISFDLCDNFLREEATVEISHLIKECQHLKNLNLSDCLNEGENQLIVKAFQETKNRKFERLGFNYIELTPELAVRLLEVLKQCPLKRLDIMGNQFSKNIKKQYSEAFSEDNLLSKFDDDEDDEEEIIRLFEEFKI